MVGALRDGHHTASPWIEPENASQGKAWPRVEHQVVNWLSFTGEIQGGRGRAVGLRCALALWGAAMASEGSIALTTRRPSRIWKTGARLHRVRRWRCPGSL